MCVWIRVGFVQKNWKSSRTKNFFPHFVPYPVLICEFQLLSFPSSKLNLAFRQIQLCRRLRRPGRETKSNVRPASSQLRKTHPAYTWTQKSWRTMLRPTKWSRMDKRQRLNNKPVEFCVLLRRSLGFTDGLGGCGLPVSIVNAVLSSSATIESVDESDAEPFIISDTWRGPIYKER